MLRERRDVERVAANQEELFVPKTEGRCPTPSGVSLWASKKSSRLIVLLLVAAVWTLIGASGAFASHFRYAQLSWQPAASPANTIDFTLQASWRRRDRKSTRLNSSHTVISYAVFCLKKKKSDK